MHLEHCFVVGTPSNQGWSQVSVQTKDQKTFILVLSLPFPQPQEIVTLKRVITESNQLFVSGELTQSKFLTFFSKNTVGKENVAGAFIEDEKVIFFAKDHANIWLSRGAQAGDVLAGKETGSFVQGKLMPNDYYVIGTKEFFDLSQDRIDTTKSPQELCEAIAIDVHSLPESGVIAGLILKSTLVTQAPIPSAERVKEEEIVKPKTETMSTVLPSPKKPLIDYKTKKRLTSWVYRMRKVFALFFAVCAGLFFLIVLHSIALKQAQQRYQQSLLPYRQRFDSATQELGSNKSQSLLDLRTLASELTVLEKNNKSDSAFSILITKLLSQVQGEYNSNSGEQHIPKLQVFYDFRLVASDFTSQAVSFDIPGKLLVFLDTSHNRLLSVSQETKQEQLLSLDGTISAASIAVASRNAFVLTSNGVVEVPLPLNQLGNVVVPTDSMWQSPKLLGAFGTNIYVLDSGSGSILKYDISQTSIAGVNWLKNSAGLDFKSVSSLQIDGNVYLTTATGKVLRYAQGNPSPLKISGLLDPFTGSLSLYTDQSDQNLYILEPSAKRIIILNKDGSYQSSIYSDDLGAATSLVADEQSHTLYILAGSLVYQASF